MVNKSETQIFHSKCNYGCIYYEKNLTKYLDQKKLTFGRLVLVFQPVISGFADFQDFAHFFGRIFAFERFNKYVSFSCLYFFRSFAKNQEHPLIFHLHGEVLTLHVQARSYVF